MEFQEPYYVNEPQGWAIHYLPEITKTVFTSKISSKPTQKKIKNSRNQITQHFSLNPILLNFEGQRKPR